MRHEVRLEVWLLVWLFGVVVVNYPEYHTP